MQSENDDIIINKLTSIKRCVERAREEYALSFNEVAFERNFSRQDAAVKNIERVSEQCEKLTEYVLKKMGIEILYKKDGKKDVYANYELLLKNKIIDEELYKKMKLCRGFRNLSVHDYETIDIKIVVSMIKDENGKGLCNLVNFAETILYQASKTNNFSTKKVIE